eukprot:TRINITY_DN46826_c0_g1_i1.p1 TRINITY_DN46826_c0_g1~~TRINITY_DN46826_c0_g1_i1.p1  ORF type:complete len:487 (+),score=136.66 TRINITY_DN46826_c0_g1_i1:81-1463(+)
MRTQRSLAAGRRLASAAQQCRWHSARKEVPKVLVLGTGWAGFNFLRNIDRRKYDVRCISPANHFLFTPLLPSCAVGTLEFRAIQEPVRTLPHLAGYYQAKATSVDWENRVVTCKDIFKHAEFELPYDYLVICCGCKTGTFNTPGVEQREGHNVFFLKHLYHARQIRNRILECFERAAIHGTNAEERNRLLTFVVVGGGPTSCEFTGELHDFLTEDLKRLYPDLVPHARVMLVEAGKQLLGTFDQALAAFVSKRFKTNAIDIKLGVAVQEVKENTVIFSNGESAHFGMLVWSAGLQPVNFVRGLGVPRGPTGRIIVDDRLRVPGHGKRVYAFGDCAVVETAPLPPIAQAAAQQAKYLANQFNAVRSGGGGGPSSEHVAEPPPFAFSSLGAMATLGGWKGVADFTAVGKPGEGKNLGTIKGSSAFFLWRTAYLGKQVSRVNKILIPMYWFKAWLFGRDISRF